MRRTPAWWLFWGAIGLIVYSYLGFPLVVALRGLLRPRAFRRGAETPLVSVLIAAYNEATVITQKLDNTFALDYPRDRLDVIVASDGSDDATNALVRSYSGGPVRLLELPRQGKNRTLNAAAALARGTILVFSDADSMFAPDALRHLVAPFADPQVGGVGGDFRYGRGEEGAGERSYWSFDRLLKLAQSRAGSMTSATGQIYALRHELFVPLPDGVTDDFYASIQVPASRRRLVFEPRAVAYGPAAPASDAEFRRKVRVMTAGLRGVWQMRRLLNPLEYGWFAIQLLSHKVLRRLMVLPVLIMGVCAPLLWRRGWLYQLAALGQAGLHLAALLGFLLRRTRFGRNKLVSLPLFFDIVHIAAVVALFNLMRGERHDRWVPQRTHPAGVPEGGWAPARGALQDCAWDERGGVAPSEP